MLRASQATIQSFRVIPTLPEPLGPLAQIAGNLWWTWHPEAASLFRRLDRDLWRQTGHNPVMLLGQIQQEKLERAAKDQSFQHALGHVASRLQAHLTRKAWRPSAHADLNASKNQNRDLCIAYFSAEFGLTECLQIYSGGLGVLSGDHLKSASELGLPLVGVGLLYRCGYFHQYLNADGWQQETYPEIDYANQPVQRVIDNATGRQLQVMVDLPDREVSIGVWRCDVGRIPLYLLDTNMPGNSPDDREITRNLYGGDVETRIKQEIVLGVGGMRALEALGVKPSVHHLNEGHSAFLALEHIRSLRSGAGVTFDEALQAASSHHVFTTHTPVPAGIDRFSPDLIERYFSSWLEPLGVTMDELLALGRENIYDKNEFFSMAVLALRTSSRCNAVSSLHGEVSRRMWRNLWPGVPEDEAPIEHITNGVHARSWIAPELMTLFDRYIGDAWLEDPTDLDAWLDINEIPDDELWQTHQEQRRKLIQWCRRKIHDQLDLRGAGHDEIEEAVAALDPNVFTIGFARRFATYKRATLLLQDRDRLAALLENEQRPVQILIAGKSHPADASGKEMIRELVNIAKSGGKLRRIVFLEDYDISIARRMLRGCDIWLNTPTRGLEASGTSGMKAAMNGVINVSILDGWWDEAYDSEVGFAIGRGESYDDTTMQDQIESRALYDLLERWILPEFYKRNASGTPRQWVRRMKRCIQKLTPCFNTNRMVAEYAQSLYFPSHEMSSRLTANNLADARALSAALGRCRSLWDQIEVESVSSPVGMTAPIRSAVAVSAIIRLGELEPREVDAQLYFGSVTSLGDLTSGRTVTMTHEEDLGEGRHRYVGRFIASESGRCGFTVRVLPHNDLLANPLSPGLITWRQDDNAQGAPHSHAAEAPQAHSAAT